MCIIQYLVVSVKEKMYFSYNNFLLTFVVKNTNIYRICENRGKDNMLEKRSKKRIQLMYFLGVFERNSGRLLGHLADITPESAMVISEDGIEPDKDYHLKIETVSESYAGKYIEVDARCIRCYSDKNTDFYDCGFVFQKIKTEDIDEIKEMDSKPGLNN